MEEKLVEVVLYILAIILTIVSFYKNKEKTIEALKKGWKAFENILPTVLCVMAVVGISLSIIDEELIVKIMGPNSGILGILIAVAIGSITIMAGFIAFPLGATLIERGAGVGAVAAFISALMMVGFVIMPLEFKYWGKKITILRNLLGIVISIIVGIVMELIF